MHWTSISTYPEWIKSNVIVHSTCQNVLPELKVIKKPGLEYLNQKLESIIEINFEL